MLEWVGLCLFVSRKEAHPKMLQLGEDMGVLRLRNAGLLRSGMKSPFDDLTRVCNLNPTLYPVFRFEQNN